jgi:molybdopterin converting factor small subunit
MMFDHAGEIWRSLILLLNDEPTALGAETPVQAGDVVTVLMPLAGG